MASSSADKWMSGLGLDIAQLRTKWSTSSPAEDGQSFDIDANGQSPVPPDAATLALQQRIRAARAEGRGAVARYDAQKDAEAEKSITSRISALNENAVDFVSRNVLGMDGDAFADPGDKVWDGTSAADDAADSAQAALDAGDSDTAAAYTDQAADAAASASRLADNYQSGMVQGAEGVEDGLTVTKVGAEATEAVLATAVTGGAAAPALAGGTAATANTVAFGMGALESIGAAGTKLAQGDNVDAGALSVDVLIQALMARFGGELTTKLSSTIAGQLAGKYTPELIQKYLSSIVARVVMADAAAELKTAAQAVIGEFSGRAVQIGDVASALLANLTDPKTAFVAVVAGAADAKLGAMAAAPSDSNLPDATADAVLLDGAGEAGGAGDADLPDATADAVPLDGAAAEDDADLPDATADAVPVAAPDGATPPPTIYPPSAAGAANAELAQMSDADIQQSVDNWQTGESAAADDTAPAAAEDGDDEADSDADDADADADDADADDEDEAEPK